MQGEAVEFEGIHISHPEKILYPEQGLTKADLATYYHKIAPFMLPELKGRPISVVRCPSGRGQCFFQKHPEGAMKEELKSIRIKEKSGSGDYIILEDERDLIYLVQLNILEIHAWGSRAPKVNYPDRMIFDLDPDAAVKPSAVIKGAQAIRGFLKEIKLESFVRTSGGKGLHVVVPLKPKNEADIVKRFAKAIADVFAESDDLYIATASKARRSNKIFIDYLRNGSGATSIANYSTRARENAPVAMPLDWSELSSLKRFDSFTTKNIFKRVNSKYRDPWKGIEEIKQELPIKKLLNE